MRSLLFFVTSIRLLALAHAQYFPPIPENVTTVQSKFGNGISISYKEVCKMLPKFAIIKKSTELTE